MMYTTNKRDDTPRSCVRPDQSSATVRCHYLTDGAVNFAFTMRRAEYFIPAGLLLKCFLEVGRSDVVLLQKDLEVSTCLLHDFYGLFARYRSVRFNVVCISESEALCL